jgi:hypothetical protein
MTDCQRWSHERAFYRSKKLRARVRGVPPRCSVRGMAILVPLARARAFLCRAGGGRFLLY